MNETEMSLEAALLAEAFSTKIAMKLALHSAFVSDMVPSTFLILVHLSTHIGTVEFCVALSLWPVSETLTWKRERRGSLRCRFPWSPSSIRSLTKYYQKPSNRHYTSTLQAHLSKIIKITHNRNSRMVWNSLILFHWYTEQSVALFRPRIFTFQLLIFILYICIDRYEMLGVFV